VSVQNVDLHGHGEPSRCARCRDVAETWFARHGCARDAEFEIAIEALQQIIGEGIAGAGIAQDANCMPALRLLARKIADMAEKAANRRSEAMQDTIAGHAELAR
jgi:hypothetical protein